MGEATATVIIYALTEPDTGEVRYVGHALHLWRRYADHLRRIHGTRAKVAWLRHLQQLGLVPGVRVLEEVPAEQAKAREGWWIEYYAGQGAALVNRPRSDDDLVRWNLYLKHGLRVRIEAVAQARGVAPSRVVQEILWQALTDKHRDPDA